MNNNLTKAALAQAEEIRNERERRINEVLVKNKKLTKGGQKEEDLVETTKEIMNSIIAEKKEVELSGLGRQMREETLKQLEKKEREAVLMFGTEYDAGKHSVYCQVNNENLLDFCDATEALKRKGFHFKFFIKAKYESEICAELVFDSNNQYSAAQKEIWRLCDEYRQTGHIEVNL